MKPKIIIDYLFIGGQVIQYKIKINPKNLKEVRSKKKVFEDDLKAF